MTDEQLMLSIRDRYSAQIAQAVAGTVYTEAFVAALVANESGGNLAAFRIEPKVFAELAGVITGKVAAFGSIGAEDLMRRVWPAESVGVHTGAQPAWGLKEGLLALLNLATSWGPTQIMGYQSIAGGYPLSELTQARTHFKHTVEVLEGFRKSFPAILDLQGYPLGGMAGFFVCWNTGRPTGLTADPNYAAKGLQRMGIYKTLPAATVTA